MSDLQQSWLILAAVPRLSVRKIHQLLNQYPVEHLVSLDADHLLALGINQTQVEAIRHPNREMIDRCLTWLSHPDHHLLPMTDLHYPFLLKQITSAPKLLFVRGDLHSLSRPQIAIVGSRQASMDGMKAAYDFAYQLADAGVQVTSGLALGIDGRAHRAALDAKGYTLAVLGSGLDVLYPKAHIPLAKDIAEQGALVSEYWPWTAPKPAFFPKRNRILSGLSTGVLVIEAGVKSGSLITARLALEQGREVFALPHSIYQMTAQGSNALIKQGAYLVDSIDDILSQVDVLTRCTQAHQPDLSAVQVLQEELPFSQLLANVGNEARCVDVLAELCDQPVSEVMMQLLELELKGLVSAVPGGYVRARRR